ncbi:hypothetical protein IWW38_005377, partial [Coemansia aciculifera]
MSLDMVRSWVKEVVAYDDRLNVNFSGKSWYTVSRQQAEIIEREDARTLEDTRFILVTHSSKIRVHLPVPDILHDRLVTSYF